MSIRSNLSRLEKLAEKKFPPSRGLAAIPPEWIERDKKGKFRGPTKEATPAEIRVYETVTAMLETMDK